MQLKISLGVNSIFKNNLDVIAALSSSSHFRSHVSPASVITEAPPANIAIRLSTWYSSRYKADYCRIVKNIDNINDITAVCNKMCYFKRIIGSTQVACA